MAVPHGIDRSGAAGGSGAQGSPPFTQEGAGAVTRTVQDKLEEFVSVKDFGAEGDGVTDDRAAIAAAVVAARGKSLFFPEGQYLIDTDGGSITLEEVGLVGEYVLDGATATLDQGSVLRITGTTNSPFNVRRGVSFRSLGFFYPNQTDSASPTAYPPTLDFDFTNGAVQFVYVDQCVVYNAYRFIRINDASGNVGHVWITDNTIYGIHRCIEVTNNLEVIKITGNTFTFGHWLAATEAGSRAYTRTNGVVLEYDDGDGFWFVDNLCFGYLRGVLVDTGSAVLTIIDGNSFDQVRYPVFASTPGTIAQFTISDNLFLAFNGQDTTLEGFAVYMSGASGADSITITGNFFGQTTKDHVVADGAASGKLTITGNTFEGMGYQAVAGNFKAVSLNCANKDVVFSGNYVEGAGTARTSGVVSQGCDVLSVVGNTFVSCNEALGVTAGTQLITAANISTGTVSATSDSISGVTGAVWQTGNRWDKPSGNSTKPAFLARKSASQTVSTATLTDIVWGTESFDRGSNFTSPTFTAPIAGRYRFSWALMHDNTGTPADRWNITLLGSASGAFSWSYLMVGDFNSVNGTVIQQLVAGETVKLQIQRVGGAGVFVTHNDGNANYFGGELLES